MKKYFYLFVFSFIIISCDNKKPGQVELELKILNDTLYAYSFDLHRDTINFLQFEITNHTDKVYYVNDIIKGSGFFNKSVIKEYVRLRIFSTNNHEVEYRNIIHYAHPAINSDELNNCLDICDKINELDIERRYQSDEKYFYYYGHKYRKSFFIHPKEKLYYEVYLNISDSLAFEDVRFGYAKLSRGEQYYGRVYLVSDSTEYKQSLPRHILKTIEANNAEVFHGIIESSNTVPVKVIE